MTHRMKTAAGLAGGLLGVLLAGCADLVDMGRARDVDPRRIYLNDPARNDSLPGTFVREGVQFVMQPGKVYSINVKNAAPTDSLVLYAPSGTGLYSPYQTLGSTLLASGFRGFTLQPPAGNNYAAYYIAFLRGPGGAPATRPDSVWLTPADTALATTLAVQLIMVGRLLGLDTDSEKAAWARAFHLELTGIFQAYGVAVDTSTVIHDPTGAPFSVDYDFASVFIPGTRRPGAVNIYLVDEITSPNPNETILGYAVREVVDMATHPESRVVLNARGGSGDVMAVTAAHEMGHFLGFRHTTATEADQVGDRDASNRDDGFASTPFCVELRKPAVPDVREITVTGHDGLVYCMRVTGTRSECDCDDVGNLMFPYSCDRALQKTLGSDQRHFLRSNLRNYQ